MVCGLMQGGSRARRALRVCTLRVPSIGVWRSGAGGLQLAHVQLLRQSLSVAIPHTLTDNCTYIDAFVPGCNGPVHRIFNLFH